MVNPVPEGRVSAGYGIRGKHWSCNRVNGRGVHTGIDFAAPIGTKVVAARGGVVRHTAYGNAFGNRQFAIRCADGTEDFYAHTRTRPPDGKVVRTGDKVAEVSNRGNATGPHLHFERHSRQGTWNCAVHRDPKLSIELGEDTRVPRGKVYLSKLVYGQKDSDSVKRLQDVLNSHRLAGGSTLPVTGNYLEQTDAEVRLCQAQHSFGEDAAKESFIGPKQAAHLFAGSGHEIIDDREPEAIPWFVPDSLKLLFAEVDKRWPNRSKSSDGTIGDVAHSKSKSEHNPVGHPFGPSNGTRGAVHAADITAEGIDSMQVVRDWIIGDDRVWYVIHNGKIWSRTYDWAERDYTGSNPHTSHLHVSLREESQELALFAELTTTPWEKTTDPVDPPEAGMPAFIYHYGKKPTERQKIGTSYGVIDRSSFTPPGDGFLLSMQYVNAKHTFKDGVSEAGFRLRCRRAPHNGQDADYSGYGDYTPNRNLTQPGTFVATHLWFEKCEANREIRWECDRAKEFATFELDTRYTKYLWVSKAVFEALEKMLGSADEVAKALAAFFDFSDEPNE